MIHRSLMIAMALAGMLTGCAKSSDFVEDYQNHPGARVDCAHFIAAHTETSSASAVDSKNPSYTAHYSTSTITGLEDDQGSIYEACLENWALEQAKHKAEDINQCVGAASVSIILAPLAPLCHLKE